MTYNFYFEIPCSIEIEAESLEEAWDTFDFMDLDETLSSRTGLDATNILVEDENGHKLDER